MVPDEQDPNSDKPMPFRRTFLTAVAGTGTTLGIGGIVYAQQTFDTIRLGGEVAAWRGRAPPTIDGESNPQLPLQAGQQYTVVWVNLDGEPHNFAILDQTGSAVVRSEIIRERGATQRIEFTAEPEMTTYLCQVHPTTMRGDVVVQGAQAAAGNVTNVTNETMNETGVPPAQLEQFRTEELEAFGEATEKFIADLTMEDVAGLPADTNITVTNETAAENVTVGNETVGNETADNETAIEAQTPDENETDRMERNETAIEEQRDPGGNETVGNETADNETAIEAQTPDENETVRNETAIEEQRDPGANATVENETVGNETVGNEIVGNETTTGNETLGNETAMENETVADDTAGNETQFQGQPEANAARFTLQPPDGQVSKLLYNIALWNIQDVTGVELFIRDQGGQNVIVASLLAPDDPVDFPQGIIAYGEITAADLLGPLAGQSLVALVDQVRNGNAYVVVRTRDRPGGALFGQIRPAPATVEAGNQTGTVGANGTNTTGGNQTNG